MNSKWEDENLVVQVTYTELEGLIRYSERLRRLEEELEYLINTASLSYSKKELNFNDVDIRGLMKRWLPNCYEAKICREKIKEESEKNG